MMLQPERLQSDMLNRAIPAYRNPVPSGRQVKQTVDSSEVNALLENLVPQGTSPTKRAVIERLVTLWLSNANQGAA